MSDESVADALRSAARLVVIEAPAGCGKTYQAAEYAREIVARIGGGRVLILTHTHAACDMIASQTHSVAGRVDIRTIDSLVCLVANAYHSALELPADTGAWARCQKNGYGELASRVNVLFGRAPMIARSLAQRYPIVVCDEHQDASAVQHAIAMALHEKGSSIRVFGDPMQRIFGSRRQIEITADCERWENLRRSADLCDELDEPHRWLNGSEAMGRWILSARSALQSGGRVDLRGSLPCGVCVLTAENHSPKRGGYHLTMPDAKPIYNLERSSKALLVLSAHNDTVYALRAFFGRRVPIWEGHVREGLTGLVSALQQQRGSAVDLAQSVCRFLNHVARGFSPTAYADTFLAEVSGGCLAKRKGKPAVLQGLARIILEQPDHIGVARFLERLWELIASDPTFKDIHVDYVREFWDAVRLGQFSDPDEGFAEIARRRSYARPTLPVKAISTVHKAKGLEGTNVLLMPCDAEHFRDSPAARCLLYVAMSRATRSLTFVVSREHPSPLVML